MGRTMQERPFSPDVKKIEELKTTHCRYFLHDTCRFADKCRLMHQEEEKELVRMEKQVKELFEKSKRVYPLDPPKAVPKKKAKEEDVTEEREASPTWSSQTQAFTHRSFYSEKP